MTNLSAHSLNYLPPERGGQAPALVFPEVAPIPIVVPMQQGYQQQVPIPIVMSARAPAPQAFQQAVPSYVTAQLAAHGYRATDSHGRDVVDGLYVRDARGWLAMKHLAQLVLCSLAVTLAIVTTIPIAVSIAWGITGLALMSVVVAADRTRFLESGRAYERARFSVIEPASHDQHVRPDTGGNPYVVGHEAAHHATTQQAPFRVNVT